MEIKLEKSRKTSTGGLDLVLVSNRDKLHLSATLRLGTLAIFVDNIGISPQPA